MLDIEGNQREVIDALGRIVMRYDYDMLGTQHPSGEHGGGRALDAERRRPASRSAPGTAANMPSAPNTTRCVGRCSPSCKAAIRRSPTRRSFRSQSSIERTIYGDSADTGLTEAQQQQANLRAKVFKHFDGAGVVTTDLYDFKGNSAAQQRASSRATTRTRRTGRKIPRWTARLSPAPPPMTR